MGPTAKNVRISVRVSERELRTLTRAAEREGISLSAYIMAPHRKEA